MIARLDQAWKMFWFKRQHWHPLGLIRIVLAYRAIKRYIPEATGFVRKELHVDPAHFFDNVGSTLAIVPYPPSQSAMPILTYGLYLSALLAMVGFFTRTSLAILGLGLLYAYSGHAMRVGFNHQNAMILQVFLILALAPGSKAWSLDRLLAIARFSWKRKAKPLQRPGLLRIARHMQGPAVPRWGLQLILALFVVVYTGAGVSKLRYSGYQWYDGQTLAYYLDGTHQAEKKISQPFFADPAYADAFPWKDDVGLVDHSYGNYSHPIFKEKLNYAWFFAAVSIATLLLELVAIVVYISPEIRNLYLLSAMAMHLSIGFAMNLSFSEYRLLILLLLSYPVLWMQITWPIRKLLKRQSLTPA